MEREVLVKELTRSVRENSREFVLRYELAVRDGVGGPDDRKYILRARVTEATSEYPSESGCELVLPAASEKRGEELFDMIACAESPVFPVHVPEIVRDELAATAMDEAVTLLPSVFESGQRVSA
ncbi:MAG: hypothetical protein IMW97_06205 [Firmicutes bacterium]|nr:hypothetical protein [Candidatus Fermentithermobacillaceae bacterium]